jgi:hypothetical protein
MHFISKALLYCLLLCSYGTISLAQSRKFVVAEGITAQIGHSQGNSTVDISIPGMDKMSLDLTQPGDGIFQIKTNDYNFDGYKDFAFVSTNPAPGSIPVYDIYLYHPLEGGFETLEVPDGICDAFGNVRIGSADKTLRSSCHNGIKTSQDIYKWADAFTLVLVNSIDNSTDTQADQSEEKEERKAEKAEQLKDKREELKDKREDHKAQKEDRETD